MRASTPNPIHSVLARLAATINFDAHERGNIKPSRSSSCVLRLCQSRSCRSTEAHRELWNRHVIPVIAPPWKHGLIPRCAHSFATTKCHGFFSVHVHRLGRFRLHSAPLSTCFQNDFGLQPVVSLVHTIGLATSWIITDSACDNVLSAGKVVA
jgi:hypothetical protein